MAAATLTASQLNQHLRDNLLAIGDPTWQSYTPTMNFNTLGNGTITGEWTRTGDTVFFRIVFTLGSTSAMGNGSTYTLPPTPALTVGNVCAVVLSDASGTFYYATSAVMTTTGVIPVLQGNYPASTVPFTWTTSDAVRISGFYRAA